GRLRPGGRAPPGRMALARLRRGTDRRPSRGPDGRRGGRAPRPVGSPRGHGPGRDLLERRTPLRPEPSPTAPRVVIALVRGGRPAGCDAVPAGGGGGRPT